MGRGTEHHPVAAPTRGAAGEPRNPLNPSGEVGDLHISGLASCWPLLRARTSRAKTPTYLHFRGGGDRDVFEPVRQ
jgi:hypothetical protein